MAFSISSRSTCFRSLLFSAALRALASEQAPHRTPSPSGAAGCCRRPSRREPQKTVRFPRFFIRRTAFRLNSSIYLFLVAIFRKGLIIEGLSIEQIAELVRRLS